MRTELRSRNESGFKVPRPTLTADSRLQRHSLVRVRESTSRILLPFHGRLRQRPYRLRILNESKILKRNVLPSNPGRLLGKCMRLVDSPGREKTHWQNSLKRSSQGRVVKVVLPV